MLPPEEQRTLLLQGLLNHLLSIRVEGVEYMPASGGAVLVCNRTNWAGTLVQLLYSGRRLIFLAPMEACCLWLRQAVELIPETMRHQWFPDPEQLQERFLFADIIPDLSEAGIMPLLKKTGPGQAKEGVAYYKKLLSATGALVRRGETIAVYGENHTFSSGPEGSLGLVARLALQARVPLIPAAIRGPGRPGSTEFRPGNRNSDRTVIYRIGSPLLPAQFPDGEDKHALKKIIALLRKQLCRLGERNRR